MAEPAVQSFDVRFLQPGKYSVMLFLPEAYHALIGLVVAHWGHFEVVFDSCLRGLIDGEAEAGIERKTKRWERQSFKDRSALFGALLTEWVSTWTPNAATQLLAILDAARKLQSQRNVIAHGTYGYSIPPYSSVAENCYALNNLTGERMPFDETVLKGIYHEISHLTADLLMAFKAIGTVEGPFHAIPDDEMLRIYKQTTHPWNSDPAMRPTAAQPSVPAGLTSASPQQAYD